jgi:ubiquinone/menaquinone biosynthesis C-methylase UbiE
VNDVHLLPEKELVRTSRVDHADWNYRPLLSYVMRRRFALILDLLPKTRVPRLLEIGFGSGIFMPALMERSDRLYGIDVHSEVGEVESRLRRCGVNAELSQQSADSIAFPDSFFDAIVSVSTLEFINDIHAAAREIARILTPDGRVVVVMPNKSTLLDFALHAATGENAERDYEGRRERVLPALLEHFSIERKKTFVPIYAAYRLKRRGLAGQVGKSA